MTFRSSQKTDLVKFDLTFEHRDASSVIVRVARCIVRRLSVSLICKFHNDFFASVAMDLFANAPVDVFVRFLLPK